MSLKPKSVIIQITVSHSQARRQIIFSKRYSGPKNFPVVALTVVLALVFIAEPAISQETIEKEDLPDLSLIKEARRLVSLYGEKAWPGFGSDLPPILIVTDEFSYLIGISEQIPNGFREIEKGAEIYVRESEQKIPSSVSTGRLAGRWTVVTPARGELEEALRRKADESGYELGEFDYVRRLIEGIFRVHALEFVGDPDGLPGSNSSMSSTEIAKQLAASKRWKSRLLNLGETLSRGLEADDLSEARELAAEVVNLTEEQPDGLDTQMLEFEKRTQWLKGTARYAGINTMIEASKGEIGLTSKLDYPNPDRIRTDLLEQIKRPAESPTIPEERLGDLGAAKGMLLDRLFPGWKEVLFEDKVSLNELLDRTLEVPEQLMGFPITEVEVAGRELTVALAADNRRRQQGLMHVTDLKSLDGMVFYFPREVEGGFWMKNTKIPLQIGYFRSSGELARSILMEPCRSENCPSYPPDKPYQYALELPQDAELKLDNHPGVSLNLTYRPYD